MRLILASVWALVCGLIVWPTSTFAAGQCGSTLMQRIAVPEYACFSLAGGVLPYAVCAAGAVAGYKPVYFGAACGAHDSCYGRRGARKSTCDADFHKLLRTTCDHTLDGQFRGRSRTSCHNLVSEYYHQVRTRGCDPYRNAQAASGNRAASCD